jgi:hypothetical protein
VHTGKVRFDDSEERKPLSRWPVANDFVRQLSAKVSLRVVSHSAIIVSISAAQVKALAQQYAGK